MNYVELSLENLAGMDLEINGFILLSGATRNIEGDRTPFGVYGDPLSRHISDGTVRFKERRGPMLLPLTRDDALQLINEVIRTNRMPTDTLSINAEYESDTLVHGNLAATGTISGTGTVEIGSVMLIAGVSGNPPSNWHICDGSTISRTSKSLLFTQVGETFGVGDGSNTFNVPNIPNVVSTGLGQEISFFIYLGE
jgi:hypothetical protein